jgi:hypothetical protein
MNDLTSARRRYELSRTVLGVLAVATFVVTLLTCVLLLVSLKQGQQRFAAQQKQYQAEQSTRDGEQAVKDRAERAYLRQMVAALTRQVESLGGTPVVLPRPSPSASGVSPPGSPDPTPGRSSSPHPRPSRKPQVSPRPTCRVVLAGACITPPPNPARSPLLTGA